MKSAISEESVASPRVWHADWLVTLGPLDRSQVHPPRRGWSSTDRMLVASNVAGSDVRIAEDSGLVVFFSGLLTNVQELRAGSDQRDAADIVLQLLNKGGKDAMRALRGSFAVIAWDHQRNALLVSRDHVGLEPLYYARVANRWLFSPSPLLLTRQPGVSADPDTVALSEWICGWYPRVEDTAFRDVKRVPPATTITIRGDAATFERYWHPAELERLPYLKPDQLGEFEPLLARVVGRSMHDLPPAIFLSGGIDSISIAVAACDVARQNGTPAPLALSLVFPDRISNEENVQRGIAEQLGMRQVLLPFATAVGPRGLIWESLSMSAGSPLPMGTVWSPAYMSLAIRGAAEGRGLILTGRGGDEWLTVTPYLIADLLKRGNVLGGWNLLRAFCRSHHIRGARNVARVFWGAGVRPLASAAMDVIAPRQWHERRRRQVLGSRPAWVAPDPEIRRAMEEHVDDWIPPARPDTGFYYRECRRAILHPALTHDMEETHEFGRRCGLRMMHPYWDVDLISLLHRVPPSSLMSDGQSKAIARRPLARRLPGLGLESRAKAIARPGFLRMMQEEAPPAWQRSGGVPALTKFGIVSSTDIQSRGGERSLLGSAADAGRLWTVMSFENWLQSNV